MYLECGLTTLDRYELRPTALFLEVGCKVAPVSRAKSGLVGRFAARSCCAGVSAVVVELSNVTASEIRAL